MHLKLQNLRLLDGRQFLAVVAFVLIFCTILTGIFSRQGVQAATASTINFQARLMNAGGSIAPDGDYNVEFKLYDTASSGGTAQGVCTGNCVWLETRTGADKVRVANGYVTVNLGSVTAFGSTIKWDQELWLTMNIGGTGSPSWDGEMSPRLKLTAVPYAFRAGQLAKLTGANTSTLAFDTQTGPHNILLPDEGGTVCIRTSTQCGFVPGIATDFIQTVPTGTVNIIQPTAASVIGLTVNGTSHATGATALIVAQSQANDAVNINVTNTSGAVGSALAVVKTGAGTLTSGLSFSGTIGTDINRSSGTLSVQGAGGLTLATNAVIRASLDTSNNLYLGNGATASSPNNFAVKATGSSAAGTAGADLTIQAGAGASATTGSAGGNVLITGGTAAGSGNNAGGNVTLQGGLDANSGTPGSVLVKNAADSATAFRVQDAGGSTSVLSVDTSTPAVIVQGTSTAGSGGRVYFGNDAITSIFEASSDSNILTFDSYNAFSFTTNSGSTGEVIHVDAQNGATTFHALNDANGGLYVKQAANQEVLSVSTAGSEGSVSVGYGGDTEATLFILDHDSDNPMEPSGTNGAMYYSTVTDTFRCYEDGNWKDCIGSSATAFVQNGNDFNAAAVLGTNDTDNLQFETNNTIRATFDQSNALYLGNGVTAASPNSFTIQGTGSTTTAVAGGSLTIQGGNATVGTANGGTVTITGGLSTGSVRGSVMIDTPTFTTASAQSCTSTPCTITQSNVDNKGVVLITTTSSSYTVSLPDPTITTPGKIIYVTNSGANDFTLSVNGGGTGNTIAMKPSTTATMIWNGGDWTAAGASSSTDLQSAYNNTLTSAGGAELLLNAPGGNADGLTIRNNGTTPIVGGLLEVQNSIGSNLFSVNNNATEYATNGGAETAGASASTFPASTWDTTTGGTVDRWTTAGDNIATGQASVRVQTTTTNHGARDRISASLTSGLTYTVSFAVRGAANFTTLQVLYSPDGTTTGTTQCTTAQTVTSGIWTRVICNFVAAGTITNSNSILIRQTDSTARTFYIDNLSVNVNVSATFAADGSVDVPGTFSTSWTDFDGGAGSTTITRETTVIYDTNASTAGDTTANANQGIRNNMAINPSINTQYLVSFYARSTTTMTSALSVGFLPAGGTSVPSGTAACVDYNTQSLVANTWTKITCLFTTTGTTITDPDLVIFQTDADDRIIYVDALLITLNTNNSNNIQIGGGNKGGPTTLFTLDRSNGAPIAANNDAYLGSLYYDTSTGRIQCYEADGWGACGAAPDNYVNLLPEYTGAVLHGSGTGTMSADFCSDTLNINDGSSGSDTICSSNDTYNFYKWTSPQSTQQTYSIYVTYQLPATFKGFSADDTVKLTARVTNTTNAAVTYEMYRDTGSGLSQCGSGETAVTTSANTWQTVPINGNEATGCSFSTSSANRTVVFRINLKANSNASAYVSNLSFITNGQ